MSLRNDFICSPESNLESYNSVAEKREPACGALNFVYDWGKKSLPFSPHFCLFRKWWKKVNFAFCHFLREYILSVFFILGFFIWNLIISSKKNHPPLVYTYERLGKLTKRSLDIVGATAGLILSAPLFLIIAILIKLDSPGPIIFKQERVGQNRRWRDRRNFNLEAKTDKRRGEKRGIDRFGRSFKVYKFRTMIDNAEKVCGPVWAKKDDPRMTNVGRILRRTRIDEFPQLINVLKGEMSLVGPRPERYFFVKNFAESVQSYHQRLSVKPGITGLAQVKNGYDSHTDDVRAKVIYDLDYIKNWSIFKDLKILAQTVLVVVTGRGAF